MTQPERDHLVAAYIDRYSREFVWSRDMLLEQVGREREENFWAFEAFLETSRKDPELCWELILQTLRTPHSESVEEVLAAGPLEDLLAHFGERFIVRVEAEAASDPKFKELLGGVWKNSMSEEVWSRVQNCRGEPW